MTAYATYIVTDKKCATCSYWPGTRKIDLIANKPFYIKADSGIFECLVQPNRKVRSIDTCPRWKLWEKL